MTPDTLLYRQVNPSWIQAGNITSQVFKPTPKDENRLSVYDGDQISAEDSWVHFTETFGHPAIGTVAVTVAECTAQKLPAEPDPDPFPEHVVIKYDDCTSNQIRSKAKQLKNAAMKRGWQFKAEASS